MLRLVSMSSPCVKVCRLDVKHNICIGCLRTPEEITKWSKLSSPEQTTILDDISWVRSNVYNFDLEKLT